MWEEDQDLKAFKTFFPAQQQPTSQLHCPKSFLGVVTPDPELEQDLLAVRTRPLCSLTQHIKHYSSNLFVFFACWTVILPHRLFSPFLLSLHPYSMIWILAWCWMSCSNTLSMSPVSRYSQKNINSLMPIHHLYCYWKTWGDDRYFSIYLISFFNFDVHKTELQEKRKESVLQPHGDPVLDRMLKAGISKKSLKVKLQNSIVALKQIVP